MTRLNMRGLLALVLTVLTLGLGQVPASAQVIGRVPYLSSNPCKGVTLSLAFARSTGSNCLNGQRYGSVTNIPGWTYTGGTAAGTGSYAAKSDGSLQFFPSYTNLLLQSQTFDNASWIKSAASTTADQALAPDGTMTADMVTENTATSAHAIFGTSASILSGSTYTASIYIKGGTRRYVSLRTDYVSASNWPWVTLDTQTGTLSANAYATGYGVVAAPNGFWRISVPWVSGATIGANIVVAGSDVSTPPASATLGNSYTGTSATFYVWGAQLELGSTASTYIPTTTAAVTVATPRITDAGYWAEEARTNSIRNNSMVGAVAGTPGTAPTNWSVSANGNGLSVQLVATGTDSVTNAPYADYRFFGTTTNSNGITLKFDTATGIAASNGQAWTISAYTALIAGSVSGFTGPSLQFDMNNSGGTYLGNSTNTTVATSATLSRTSWAFTTNQATTAYVTPYIIVTPGSGKSVDFTLRVSLPQMELGSFATSPIPTTSVAVTRAADVGSVTVSPGVNQTTLIGYTQTATSTTDGLFRFAPIAAGSYVGAAAGGGSSTGWYANGLSGLAGSNTGANLLAIATTSGNLTASRNGAAVVTSAASDYTGGATSINVGVRSAGGLYANGPIRRIVIYPRAFGNSELQAITIGPVSFANDNAAPDDMKAALWGWVA